MALTITYDGFGVVANADDIAADSAGGNWAELGLGTISDNPDVYLYSGGTINTPGPQSIGSKYNSKNGYTYFNATTSLNFTTTESGQLIYMWVNILASGAFETLANNGFSVMVGSDTSNHYMWKVAGSDDANGWTGGWKCFVLDLANIPTGVITTGTPDHTAINTFGFWVDNAAARADSLFQSQIFCAKGLKVTGTSVVNGLDEIVEWCIDYPNRAAGMFQKRGNTYFSLGSLTIGDGSTTTVFESNGNNLEYEASEFWNGTAWVSTMGTTINNINMLAAATVVNQDVGISGFIDNKLALDTSLSALSTYNGGYIKYLRSITVSADDTFSGTIFSLNDALSLGAATYDGCTFNDSGSLTIISTTTFDNNKINPSDGVTGLITPDLDIFTGCVFTSGGTGHAVELTSLDDGTFNWDTVTSGYDTGTAASPVTPTNTGDEDIWVNVASGTVTISVAAGATVPSIRSAGATVNVASGQVTLTVNVQDEDKNPVNLAQTSIHLLNSPFTALMNEDTNASGIATEQYSFVSDIDVVYKVRKSEDTDDPRYIAQSGIAKITADSLNITVTLKVNPFL